MTNSRIADLFSAHPTLCEPLSDDDQQSLLSSAQQGDGHARERLVCSFTRLLKSRIGKAIVPRGVEREELFAEGLAAMVRGLDSYNPSKGVSLCGFLRVVIDRAIWRAVSAALPMSPRTADHPRVESLEPDDPDRPSPSHRLADPALAPDRLMEQVEQRQTIEGAMTELDERGEWVMRAKFGLCAPPSHRLGTRAVTSDVTRERLHQLEALAIRTLMSEREPASGDRADSPGGGGSYYSKTSVQQDRASSFRQTRLFDPVPNDNG